MLFRTSSHAVQIEVELTRRNVPHVKFGGLKFLDREWRSVHILNAVDGCIPSDLGKDTSRDLEEERRLL